MKWVDVILILTIALGSSCLVGLTALLHEYRYSTPYERWRDIGNVATWLVCASVSLFAAFIYIFYFFYVRR